MKSLYERLKLALGQDKSIAATIAELETHEGKTEAYLDELGLSRSDLKKLERKGLAIRGYTQNYWGPGDVLPSGKCVGEKEQYRGQGSRVRWIIVGGN